MATTTTNVITVKMTLGKGKDIRRFSVNPTSFNWAAATKRAEEAFDFAGKKFKMTYVDDEKDKITISSDEELSEAVVLALADTPTVLRLTVHPVDNKTDDKAPADRTDKSAADKEIDDSGKQLASLVEVLMKQLPTVANQIHAFVHPHVKGMQEGVHPGVTCDKSGMSPIVGNRYKLEGHNYDLCEAEFQKLDEEEKAKFRLIAPPSEAAKIGFHPGVSCDRTGMCPIVGVRYNLRGRDYDLCQAEFDKLGDAEKTQYDAIPPPCVGGPFRPWRANGGWRRGSAFGKGIGGKGGGKGGGMGCGMGGKLGARFICDKGLFDGTQVAPGTPFTKIWRIKNSGEVAWPPGTRMLFVGGDQMTTEMSVPIGRNGPVQPGEEVNVAVEMTAPAELGRYLGYWRLTGPFLRRRWGQRVWCHVQVVDPSQPANALDVDGAVAELEKMKMSLGAEDGEDDAAEDPGTSSAKDTSMATMGFASSPASVGGTPSGQVSAAEPTVGTDPAVTGKLDAGNLDGEKAVTDKLDGDKPDTDTHDDAVLVTDKMVTDAQPAAEAAEALSGVDQIKASLKAMGFLDEVMLEAAITKHGEDIDACATDLAKASEWDGLLDDLVEMGFDDRERNKVLMLKNNGNIKRTVKDLIEA